MKSGRTERSSDSPADQAKKTATARQGVEKMRIMKLAQAVFDPDRSTNPRAERVALLHALVPAEGLSVHQKAYRFGLANPNLSAVVSNMVDEKQVVENLSVVGA